MFSISPVRMSRVSKYCRNVALAAAVSLSPVSSKAQFLKHFHPKCNRIETVVKHTVNNVDKKVCTNFSSQAKKVKPYGMKIIKEKDGNELLVYINSANEKCKIRLGSFMSSDVSVSLDKYSKHNTVDMKPTDVYNMTEEIYNGKYSYLLEAAPTSNQFFDVFNGLISHYTSAGSPGAQNFTVREQRNFLDKWLKISQ